MTQRTALLLDMDYLCFEAMAAVGEDWCIGDNEWTVNYDLDKAQEVLERSIASIRKRHRSFEDALLIAVFSGDNNWRKLVLETYKANRNGKRKPAGYGEFVKWQMENRHGHYAKQIMMDTLEGDDVLGIFCTNPEALDLGVSKAVMVSCDKDFNTVPGRFYWLTNGKLLVNTEAQADRWHLYQAIKGDVTDGYGGIKGIGEMVGDTPLLDWLDSPTFFYQATKVMKSGPRKGQEVSYWTSREPAGETRWECIVSLAKKQGMDPEEVLKNAQVARIARNEDFDWEAKRVVPWQPTRSAYAMETVGAEELA